MLPCGLLEARYRRIGPLAKKKNRFQENLAEKSRHHKKKIVCTRRPKRSPSIKEIACNLPPSRFARIWMFLSLNSDVRFSKDKDVSLIPDFSSCQSRYVSLLSDFSFSLHRNVSLISDFTFSQNRNVGLTSDFSVSQDSDVSLTSDFGLNQREC